MRVGADDREYVLRVLGHGRSEHPNTLVLEADGFSSALQALDSARQAITKVRAAFALERLGMSFMAAEQVFESPNHGNAVLAHGFDGIIVYPQDAELGGAQVTFSSVASANATRLSQAIERALNEDTPACRLAAAIELYLSVPYQGSDRAKYLQLTTVVESLSEQEPLSERVLEVYRRCKEIAKESLPPGIRDSWLSRLGQLKRESISQSCTRTVQEVLGADTATQFRELYAKRSSLIHALGDAEPNLSDDLPKLSNVVYKLIASLIRSSEITNSNAV